MANAMIKLVAMRSMKARNGLPWRDRPHRLDALERSGTK